MKKEILIGIIEMFNVLKHNYISHPEFTKDFLKTLSAKDPSIMRLCEIIVTKL